jgi:hypothetical protein
MTRLDAYASRTGTEPAEIHTEAGAYSRRGTDYGFATWAQLEDAA